MSETPSLPHANDFENQKTRYFVKLGVHLKDALRLHKASGLWDRNQEGEREWGNVSEHCLVEAARAREFGELLGFDKDLVEDMMTAAALHDHYKKVEKAIAEKEGLTWAAYEKAEHQSGEAMLAAGFSDRVVWLAGAVGHNSLATVQHIFDNAEESTLAEAAENDAFLVMHYIDDYTVGSDWAEPTGEVSNFDARVNKNEANEKYRIINEAGREHFDGETTFEVQRRIGHDVESWLADLVGERVGDEIFPEALPIFIDNQIRSRIIQVPPQAA